MTIFLKICHSLKIKKAWGVEPIYYGNGFVRCNSKGEHKPLSDKTKFYTPMRVLEMMDKQKKNVVIFWDKTV